MKIANKRIPGKIEKSAVPVDRSNTQLNTGNSNLTQLWTNIQDRITTENAVPQQVWDGVLWQSIRQFQGVFPSIPATGNE
jgi:hypothetical protein